MAHDPGMPPRARALVAAGLRVVEAYDPAEQEGVFAGVMRGLALGLALARADPVWAVAAVGELEAHTAALWGDEPPARRPGFSREAAATLERADEKAARPLVNDSSPL